MTGQNRPEREDTFENLSKNATTLANYLLAEIEAGGGPLYVKSKFIAEDLNLSTHEIGQLLRQLQDANIALDVEPWGKYRSTTWRIAARSDGDE